MDYEEIAPCIFVYEDAYDKCDDLIHRSLRDRGAWKGATVGANVLETETRDCNVLSLNTQLTGHVDDILLAKMFMDHADHYGKQTHSAISDMEPLQLLHYTTANQHYKPHADDGADMPRLFSAVLYLNDVEEGGDTRFTRFDISVQPKAGRLVMFPANFAYEHEAKPPVSNEKFVVVTWFTPVMRWLQR